MGVDRREKILARLLVLSTGMAGISAAYRNKLGVNENDLDVVIVHDGDELGDERDPLTTRPVNSPRRIIMNPLIEIIAGGAPEAIGSLINGYRAQLIKAICQDSILRTLVVDGLGIQYLGCLSGAGLGNTMEANMVLNFRFTYRLVPDEL